MRVLASSHTHTHTQNCTADWARRAELPGRLPGPGPRQRCRVRPRLLHGDDGYHPFPVKTTGTGMRLVGLHRLRAFW